MKDELLKMLKENAYRKGEYTLSSGKKNGSHHIFIKWHNAFRKI